MLLRGEGLGCVRGERRVFDNLSMRLAPGEALLLTGANGAGKSSLLRVLAGLLPAASGALSADGVALTDDRAAYCGRLHYIGHLDPIKPAFTVRENLEFWAGLSGANANPGPASAQALELMGISHLAGIPARLLSAGQRRRLNLARLTAAPKELWLLDEPTVALDADAVSRLGRMIMAHLGAGGSAVIASHAELGFTATHTLHLQWENVLVREAAQ